MNSVRVNSLEQKGDRLSFQVLNIDLIGGCSVLRMGTWVLVILFSVFSYILKTLLKYKYILEVTSLLFHRLMIYPGRFYASFMLVIMSLDFFVNNKLRPTYFIPPLIC